MNNQYSTFVNVAVRSALVLVVSLMALAVPSTAQQVNYRIMTASDLAKATDLQRKVSLSFAGVSLSDLLSKVSDATGIPLAAERSIGDQRVTIIIRERALSVVMRLLTELLSHKSMSSGGYYWRKSENVSGDPVYRLSRTDRSRTEEADALDYPRRKSIAWLHEIHRILSASPGGKTIYQSDLPSYYFTEDGYSVFLSVVKNLTDAQIDQMAVTGKVSTPTVGFEDRIQRFNRMWKSAQEQARITVKQAEGRDIFPNGVPDAPPSPPSATFSTWDAYSSDRSGDTAFAVSLPGIYTVDADPPRPGMSVMSFLLFDPLDLRKLNVEQNSTPDDSPKVNLEPQLQEWKATDKQRGDFAYLLKALGTVAKIDIYEEHFLRPIGFGRSRVGVFPAVFATKGTARSLLDSWCAENYYLWERRGDEYFLWSKAWAFDRQADVSEATLNYWRKRRGSNGALSKEYQTRLVQSCTWQQFNFNLKFEFPELGNWARSYFLKVHNGGSL